MPRSGRRRHGNYRDGHHLRELPEFPGHCVLLVLRGLAAHDTMPAVVPCRRGTNTGKGPNPKLTLTILEVAADSQGYNVPSI